MLLLQSVSISARTCRVKFATRSFTAYAPTVRRSVFTNAPFVSTKFVRAYSAAASLSRDDIQSRIFEILKGFDKVDATKVGLLRKYHAVSYPLQVAASSHFTNDLGLDSLDTVEVVMAIEEEFSIEIPDKDADEIKTVQQAIDYVAKTEEGECVNVDS